MAPIVQPCRLFVAGLAYAVTDDVLAEHFSRTARVVRAKVVMDRVTERSRGFGFVTCLDPQDAEAAMLALDGSDLLGRRISVRIAEDRRPHAGESSPRPIP